MKYDCEVIRDLLPLYADRACSEHSRTMVEAHLQECPDCRRMVSMLLDTRIENELQTERESVLDYGARQFRRRSAIVGSAVSGSLTIPVLIILALSMFAAPQLSWISLVMAGFVVLASLIVVPLVVREDKLFWTFCAFCASLILLLGVACAYSHGDWFAIAASAVLFGMSVVFLPFLIRARPVKRLIGESNRLMIVLGVDFALFFNLLTMVDTRGRLTLNHLLFSVGIVGGIVCVLVGLIRNRKTGDSRQRKSGM